MPDPHSVNHLLRIVALLLVLHPALIFPSLVAAQNRSAAEPLLNTETTPQKNLKVFDALWGKVNKDYFDPQFNGADWTGLRDRYRPQAAQAGTKAALKKVLEQMVSELKTSHVSVRLAVSRKKLEQQLAQKVDRKRDSIYLSPGIEWRKIENQFVITKVVGNSRASAVGVRPGWRITHYGDQPLPMQEIQEIYEGLEIPCRFLDLENRERVLVLKYDWSVEKPLFKSELLTPEIGYVKFNEFTADADNQLEQAVTQFRTTRAIIMDLRSNRGGYEHIVRNCLNLFFVRPTEYGTFIERSGKTKQPELKGRGTQAYSGTLLVLTDEESGSGAEIFAAIVQESRRGQILGRTTAGAVLLSYSLKLPEDFRLTLAFRDYQTPNGRRLEGRGVEPDIQVPLTVADIRDKRDPDLERALALLQGATVRRETQ